MKRFLLSLTLLLTAAGIAFAQSVTVNKIWLEKDVTLNGKQGMKIHFYLKTNGLKDVPMSAIAYFDEPKGVGVKDTDGRWCTTSGTVAIWADFTPIYESSVWDDYWFFTAYEDLHIKDYSKTYYCHVFVFDKQGKQYGNTEYVAFQVKQPVNNNAHLAPAAGSFPNQQTIYVTNADGRGGILSLYCFYANGEKMIRCNLGSSSYLYRYVDDAPDRILFREGTYQPVYGQFNTLAWKDNIYGHALVIFKDWSQVNYVRGSGDYTEYKQFTTKAKYDEYQQALQRLNAMQSMNGGGGGYSPGGGNYNSGSGGSTPSYDNNLSESYYREMYSMWERNAESAYNSLTTLGASITYSDGSKEGSTLGSWSSSDYTRLKQDLRKAQSEMRTIRSEASRAGYTIHPSHWESASVSY